MKHPLKSHLESCLAQSSFALTESIQDRLLHYLDLLIKWNRAYNLTAIRDPKEMIAKHLIDSLSIVPFITGDRVLDVGSGAGLPGIPLAIVKPELYITLLDSNGKKTRFLTQVKADLKLENVTVIQARVEAYQPNFYFDCIVSRAFATIADTLALAHHLCDPQDPKATFLLMKGIYPEQELAELPSAFEVKAAHRLSALSVEGERHLVCVGRIPPTPL